MNTKSTMNLMIATLTIAGGVLLGLGGGFFLLQKSPLFFAGSLMLGLGLGLLLAAFIVKEKVEE